MKIKYSDLNYEQKDVLIRILNSIKYSVNEKLNLKINKDTDILDLIDTLIRIQLTISENLSFFLFFLRKKEPGKYYTSIKSAENGLK